MNSLYMGVDFHPHQQTIAWCDKQTGETQTLTLEHDIDKVRQFYQALAPSIIGVEASSKAIWFENLLAETNHQLVFGNPTLIRKRAVSRHKSDRRDAELILELLLREEFPAIWRRSPENDQVLEVLGLRSSMVRQRTQTYNRLQALAKSHGLPRGSIKTKYYQEWLKAVEMNPGRALQRSQLLALVESFDQRITELDEWLKQAAAVDSRVQLLMTQPGVGVLTALAVVNAIGRIDRFDRPTRQIPAYLGMEALERESAGKRRAASISRAGNQLTRCLLGQAVHIAIRTDQNLKSFYQRLAKKKPKAVAKMATARKLLVKLVIMWRDEISATEFDRRGGGRRSQRCSNRSGSAMIG